MPDGWKRRNGGKNQSEKSIKGKDSKKITWDKNDKNRQKGALNIYVNVTHKLQGQASRKVCVKHIKWMFWGSGIHMGWKGNIEQNRELCESLLMCTRNLRHSQSHRLHAHVHTALTLTHRQGEREARQPQATQLLFPNSLFCSSIYQLLTTFTSCWIQWT